MLAHADHNNMGSLSKQHEKAKMANSTVHIFQRFEMFKFQILFGGSIPLDPPRSFWRLRHKEHRTLVPLTPSAASISLFGNFKT